MPSLLLTQVYTDQAPILATGSGIFRFCLMWRTQYGDRILEGAEAIVFAEALLNLLDGVTLCDFDDYELGIKCFDSLTYGQKISVLAIIGNGLLRKDIPVPLKNLIQWEYEIQNR